MKWIKIDQKTGEPIKRCCNSFMPHDYIADNFRIINNSWSDTKSGWILTKDGEELGRFNTLKEAKAKSEEMRP